MYSQNEIQQLLEVVDSLLMDDNLAKAETILVDIHEWFSEMDKGKNQGIDFNITFAIAALLIDLATGLYHKKQYDLTKQYTCLGLGICTEIEKDPLFNHKNPVIYYNMANGYSNFQKLEFNSNIGKGIISPNYEKEKNCLREAIRICEKDGINEYPPYFICELYTNYANCLDSIKRNIEALEWYDRAIKINPQMAHALGNKAIVLHDLAFSLKGYTHLYVLQAKKLFIAALNSGELESPAREKFSQRLENINHFIDFHQDEVKAEKIITLNSKNDFHKFLISFCANNCLNLNPSTNIDGINQIDIADSLFPSTFYSELESNDINEYIRYFNQIKQDYIFARYLLAQSQYVTEITEIIDEGVEYYFDYTAQSSYIEMMKVSLKLSFDILDKIASFIRFYFKLTYPRKDGTYFSNIFKEKGNENKLQDKLLETKCFYLMALYDLSRDIFSNNQSEYNFMKKRRNLITHQFINIYDISKDQHSDTDNWITITEFRKECITTLKTVRYAIFYLVQTIEFIENEHTPSKNIGTIHGTKVDRILRWRPLNGDIDNEGFQVQSGA